MVTIKRVNLIRLIAPLFIAFFFSTQLWAGTCTDFLSKLLLSPKIERVELESEIKNLLPILNKKLIKMLKNNPDHRYGHLFKEDEDAFSCPLCVGASNSLKKMLKGGELSKYQFQLVRTTDWIFNDSIHWHVLHQYIRVKTKRGESLIIDPTIRQFFASQLNKEKIRQIPEVFVGTDKELKKLFYQHYTDDLIERFGINNYFKTYNRGPIQNILHLFKN